MATQIVSHRLPTALQVAARRAKAIARAEFERRHDAAAYRCRRDGKSWIAEGAGQRFEFSKTSADDVLVMSASGGIYLITVSDLTGELVCDCPAHRKAGTCKHLVGLDAVRMHHAMTRRAALTDAQREELLAGAA